MIPQAFETHRLRPHFVFDPVDLFAERRAVAGPHPRPNGPLHYQLMGEVIAGQRQNFKAPIDLAVVTNPTGFGLFLGQIPRADGNTGRLNLAAGTYVVRVTGASYQVTEREDIVMPQVHPAPGPYLFALEPGYAYPFPKGSTLGAGRGPTLLRGCLQQRNSTGIEGAEITVLGQSNTYRTDPTGQWVLVFTDAQPAGDITVRFRLPLAGGGFNTINVAGIAIVPGESSTFLQSSLEGVVLTQADVPISGAQVQVVGQPNATASGNDGTFQYYFPVNQGAVNVDVQATHPDGSTLTRTNVPVTTGQTTPVETFRF